MPADVMTDMTGGKGLIDKQVRSWSTHWVGMHSQHWGVGDASTPRAGMAAGAPGGQAVAS